jgi:class 3 adenylate cyclase
MSVEISILGPVEAARCGRAVDLGGPQQRALLALLAIRGGAIAPVDTLIDALWPDDPPASAAKIVQTYVSRLRKVLGEEAIERRGGGYALRAARESLDLFQFEDLAAADRPAEALALWRGPALADLAALPALRLEAERLEELRLAALEQRIDADLRAERSREVVAELRALVGAHPLRERLRVLLMLALYRSGRQAEALAAYRDFREYLGHELALEPTSELRQLHLAILRQDPALGPDAAPALVGARAGSAQNEGGEVSEASEDPWTRATPDRRVVTVVFCDLADSTSLGEELDPEALRHVLVQYYRAASEVLTRHGGVVEKFIGDAVVAVFGVPQLHDDDALRAVRAAVELREKLNELSRPLEVKQRIAVAVRIGINTGEVISADTGRGDAIVTGDAVNLAARLEQAASPGEIMLGATTLELVRDAVRVDPLVLELRGKSRPVAAARLLELHAHPPEITGGLRAPLVGRERDLAALREILLSLSRAPSCHLCIVVGPPGIGKSRLAHEFLAEVGATATVASGRCLSYGEGITYWPLREIVRTLAGGDPREWIKERLPSEAGAAAVAERVAAAAGVGESGAQPQETFWAFRTLFETVATKRPLVLVIDDIHWAEPTLFELLDHLVGLSAGAPILLLCLARPELFENRPEWAAPQLNKTVLALAPLADAEANALVERLQHADKLTEEARRRAVEAGEGNPLFLEQLVAFESEGGTTVMPPSVHALLAARIDRLPASERLILERAAIEGREFQRASIAELLPPEEVAHLDERLLTLVRKDFIQPRRTAANSAGAFAFRHSLVRDAAYAAMTKATRAALHERHADWLERTGGEDEMIGYHLEQACRYRAEVAPTGEMPPDLAVRAAKRLGSAGRTALNRGDIRGAANLLSRAAALSPPEAGTRLKVLPDLAEALSSIGELAHAEQVLAEAVDRATASGDVVTGWRARLQRTWLRLQADPSVEVAGVLSDATVAVEEFERLHDDRSLAHAWHLIAWVHMTYGELSPLAEALRHGRQHAKAAGDTMTEEDLAVIALLVLPTGPHPAKQVISDAEAALQRAQSGGSRRVEAAALLVLAMCAAFEGRFDQARQLLAQATAIDEELGGGRGSGFQYTPAGMIELLAGNTTRAERELRLGYEMLRERGDAWFLCGVAAELADVLWLQGRDEEALELTRLSEDTVGADVRVAQMMWRGARAKVLARRGQADEAQALAREGVAIIRQTDYILYHADALTDLAEVLRLGDQASEAAAAANEARLLYEQKGNIIAARHLHSMLEELRPPRAAAR